MAFECPRRSSPPSPMFDADTGCIATDPAPSARRRFRSKTGIENLPANEHAQETPHTPSPTRTTRRIQSGCAGSRPRLRDGMPGSPSQHIDITRAKWTPYSRIYGIHLALVIVKFTFVSNAIRVGRNKAVHRCFLVCFQHATRPDGRAKWIPYFRKLGIHFALVSPTFGFRGCDDRRLGPCRGPARAAPPAGAVGRKAGHEPANGGD